MLTRLKLFKVAIARITPFLLLPSSFFLITPLAQAQTSPQAQVEQRSPSSPTASKALVEQVFQIVEKDYVDSTFNWQDWQSIRQRYLSRTYQSPEEAYAAIQEILKGLDDPFTRFMNPVEFKTIQVNTNQNTTGIGLNLKFNETTKELDIVNVLEDSPAQSAGILEGDILLKINHQRTYGATAVEAISLLRGTARTSVLVTVRRGQKELSFQVNRTPFKLKQVQFRSQNSAIGKVGYIRFSQFSAAVPSEMRNAIQMLEQESVVGYVLDVRSNQGGLLYVGVEIARQWLNEGLLLWMITRHNKPQTWQANHKALTQKPLVVLVNGSSAAASEILAGALQDYRRAALVGTRTSGLNSIQSVRSLKGGSGLSTTVSRWFTPSGRDISKTGLIPDETVVLSLQQQQTLGRQRSLLGTSADPQYVEAIRVLASRRSFSSSSSAGKTRTRGITKIEADLLLRQGFQAYQSSRFATAIQLLQRALVLYSRIGDRQGEGRAKGGLGFTYRDLGEYYKAIAYYQNWLQTAREIKDSQGVGRALGSLGNAYRSLRQFARANEFYKQSLIIATESKDYLAEGRILGNLGSNYVGLGNYAQAIDYSQQSLLKARAIKDRHTEGRVLSVLGAVNYLLGNEVKAVDYQQQSLRIAREIKDRQGEGFALYNLGLALHKSGNLGAAEKTLFDAINVLESIRRGLGEDDANKVSIFETQAGVYRTLQQILVAQRKTGTALEVAERGRAKAFVELLERRSAESSQVLAANRQTPANQATANQTTTNAPTIQQIKQIAKTHSATLVQYSIIYDTYQIQGKSESRESALYIWVTPPAGEITFRQVDLKSLWQQHNTSLAKLTIEKQEFLAVRSRSSSSSTKPQPNLPTLHQLLIEPIASLLPKDPNAHVVFIPQGSLFQVPFPALQDTNGTYLILKHTILTAPSIQALALTRQQHQRLDNQKPGNALVLGNPTMPSVSSSPGAPRRSLSPLPGAEIEAKAIAPLLNTQAIIGAQGTKAAIVQKMPQASIIHLATHGILDDVRGLGSAIALAPSGKDNGLLTAEEILDMRLRANLVVLSACNTAQGRTTGDGIIGLSRSFISAGVPSVIVSLWSIPDAPTAELMQAFYQNLQKNTDKAQALRQAMLTTMKTHPQPRNWAAFTLIGEAD
ncbi:CHAT domain-containing protein [Phormidesmis priestleyi]